VSFLCSLVLQSVKQLIDGAFNRMLKMQVSGMTLCRCVPGPAVVLPSVGSGA